RVEAGTVLGVMGQTGTSTATHLHLEAYPEDRFALVGDAFATTGRAVDPEPYLLARGVDLHAGTVTVGRPGPSTGTVPDITIPGPVAPIVPEEDIVASIQDLERVVGDAVAPLRRALRAYRLDVPGAQALYAQVGGTARVWLKAPAEVAAVAPGGTVPLPADDAFW
ncbi:hypothetical protein G3I71_46845, partial [Streptomyces sp. SID12501]|nr:hypothetical protein [Streptomyces sp. SID12501]